MKPDSTCCEYISGAWPRGRFFRNAIRSGLDVLASLYAARTEVGTKFDEIRGKDGLGAALGSRAAQFKE